ncbi:MAG: UDP-3-O-(3-hydroxymyristoyl)glucosamine N-acyltransferase [Blastocatellia bacterium]
MGNFKLADRGSVDAYPLISMKTLGELAHILKAELVGDPESVVRRARSFKLAGEGDVTLAADAAYRARINESRATAVIVAASIDGAKCNLLIAANPKLAFARAIHALHSVEYLATGVSNDLVLGKGSTLGKDLSIRPRVTIGADSIVGDRVTLHSGVVIGNDCRVGDDGVIYPNVAIYPGSEIGRRVIIHAGTVIGADGFSFVPDEDGRQFKLLQLGRVIIEDDCEIGANCAIDRGGFQDTILRRGVKLDNLIQVGHGCEIGEDTVVAALVGFAGGTIVGRGCVFAGQAGTNHHVTIGDGSTVIGQAGVTKNVKAGAVIAGMGQEYNSWRRSQVLYSKLPELAERLRRVEAAIVDPQDKERE